MTSRNLALALVLFAGLAAAWADTPTQKAASAPAPAIPAPEYITYKPDTLKMLIDVYRLVNDSKYTDAEKSDGNLLQYDPACLEARWMLAALYKKTGEYGNMIDTLASVGVREAKESAFERKLVYQGARGYVLQADANTIRVDYTNAEVKPGDSLVVYTEGAVLQHPITLQILYVEKRLIAEVEIKSTSSSHSIAEIVKVYGDIKGGMRVMPKADYNDLMDESTPASASGGDQKPASTKAAAGSVSTAKTGAASTP